MIQSHVTKTANDASAPLYIESESETDGIEGVHRVNVNANSNTAAIIIILGGDRPRPTILRFPFPSWKRSILLDFSQASSTQQKLSFLLLLLFVTRTVDSEFRC